jgi:hypothetical protein
MSEIVEFINSNWSGVLAVLAAVHALAIAIVNLTPTPADDAVVAKVYRVIEVLAGIITPNAKDAGAPSKSDKEAVG